MNDQFEAELIRRLIVMQDAFTKRHDWMGSERHEHGVDCRNGKRRAQLTREQCRAA